MVPCSCTKSFTSTIRDVSGIPCLIFKLVSPSKLEVSMNEIPCGSLDDSWTRSAGKKLLFSTFTISPTAKFFHFTFVHCPFCRQSISRLFISSSARWRFCSRKENANKKSKIKVRKVFSYRATHEVLDDLLERTHCQNENQWHECCVSTCWRDIRYLLKEGDEEEEAIRIAPKLFEQK